MCTSLQWLKAIQRSWVLLGSSCTSWRGIHSPPPARNKQWSEPQQPPKHRHGLSPCSEDTSKASSDQPATSWLKSLELPPTYRKKVSLLLHTPTLPQVALQPDNLPVRGPWPQITPETPTYPALYCLDKSLCFCFFCKPQPFQGNLAQVYTALQIPFIM